MEIIAKVENIQPIKRFVIAELSTEKDYNTWMDFRQLHKVKLATLVNIGIRDYKKSPEYLAKMQSMLKDLKEAGIIK